MKLRKTGFYKCQVCREWFEASLGRAIGIAEAAWAANTVGREVVVGGFACGNCIADLHEANGDTSLPALPPMPVRSEGFDGQPEVLAEYLGTGRGDRGAPEGETT